MQDKKEPFNVLKAATLDCELAYNRSRINEERSNQDLQTLRAQYAQLLEKYN
ncbi:hypothetical protein NX059_007788 [Plenodomus lindquistii]|nr:hypothetical protein NX059_007788 [Plenodomus lindquistii]